MLGFTLNEIAIVLQDIQSGLCSTAKLQIKDLLALKIGEIENQVTELNALKHYLTEQITKIERSDVLSSKATDCSCLGEKMMIKLSCART